MTADQFFAKYLNTGIDFDGYYGFQCMDLYQQYNKECVFGPVVHGNAIDMWTRYSSAFYERIENTPGNCPVKGDVVIWGSLIGQYGHIAVCKEADPNKFTSFDQNWPIGSVSHFENHSYVGVLGWLRPKVTPAPDVPAPAPEPLPSPPMPEPLPPVEPPVPSPEPPTDVPAPEPTIPTPPVAKPSLFTLLIEFLMRIFKKG